MKKTIVLAVLSLSLAASAAWEKIATFQLAGPEVMSAAASEIGGFTGNPLVGMMIAAQAAKATPFADFFGPAREGACVLFPLYIETGKEPETFEQFVRGWEYAVLYPVKETKAQFLKRHPGAVETNGFIRVKGACGDSGCQVFDDDIDDSEDYAEDEITYNYIAFTGDGKWAAMSDKPEQVKLALGELKAAEKPMGGDLARTRLLKRGAVLVATLLEAQLKGETNEQHRVLLKRNATIFRNAEGAVLSLSVSDKGIDLKGGVKVKEGSPAAVYGTTALGERPLGFAATNAVFAQAGAANAPNAVAGNDGSRRRFEELKATMKNSPIDFGALQLRDVSKKGAFPYESEGVFDGIAVTPSLAERFEKTLPELVGRPLFSAAAFTTIPSIEYFVPPYRAKLPAAERVVISTTLKLLPKNSETAIAAGAWREKDSLRMLVRIPADEIRAVCLVIGATMAQAQMRVMGARRAGAASGDED